MTARPTGRAVSLFSVRLSQDMKNTDRIQAAWEHCLKDRDSDDIVPLFNEVKHNYLSNESYTDEEGRVDIHSLLLEAQEIEDDAKRDGMETFVLKFDGNGVHIFTADDEDHLIAELLEIATGLRDAQNV